MAQPARPQSANNASGSGWWGGVAETIHESVVGVKADQQRAEALFGEAEARFRQATTLSGSERQKAFCEAADTYHEAAERWPKSSLEEDALMMAAECYFFADTYPKATTAYAALVKKHPTTRHLDRVDQRRFAIAQYWLGTQPTRGRSALPNFKDKGRPMTDTFQSAVKLYNRIRYDNPNGKLADDATMAAAVANFERGRYVEADELFSDIRDNFPTSDHQFRAHLLGLKCKLATYEGPDYDGTVLDKGEEIVKRMVYQFPDESEPHRVFLENAYRDIQLKKAERDYSIARYYDRRREYGAARIYYEAVRRQYPATNLALEAEGRLAQIDGLPDVPNQSMQWLADLFPQEEEARPLLTRSTPPINR